MADIEAELNTHLMADTNVTALLSDKYYPTHKPQGIKPPYAVYYVISDNSNQCLGGGIYQNETRIQINLYGTSYAEVVNIKNAVKDSVVGFKSSYDINVIDGYDDNTEYFKKILDFKLKN